MCTPWSTGFAGPEESLVHAGFPEGSRAGAGDDRGADVGETFEPLLMGREGSLPKGRVEGGSGSDPRSERHLVEEKQIRLFARDRGREGPKLGGVRTHLRRRLANADLESRHGSVLAR